MWLRASCSSCGARVSNPAGSDNATVLPFSLENWSKGTPKWRVQVGFQPRSAPTTIASRINASECVDRRPWFEAMVCNCLSPNQWDPLCKDPLRYRNFLKSPSTRRGDQFLALQPEVAKQTLGLIRRTSLYIPRPKFDANDVLGAVLEIRFQSLRGLCTA